MPLNIYFSIKNLYIHIIFFYTKQDAAVYATEYYDTEDDRGALKMYFQGDLQSIYFDNSTYEVTEVSGKCNTFWLHSYSQKICRKFFRYYILVKNLCYSLLTNNLFIFCFLGTNCTTKDEDLSDYLYTSIYYGWLNKDPLVIGPSAALWFAQSQRDKIVSYLKLKEKIQLLELNCISVTFYTAVYTVFTFNNAQYI